MKFTTVNRRAFLRQGLTGILAAGAAPHFLPARLLGAAAPSRKVTLGCIGLGVHGFGVNLKQFLEEEDCRIVAVCDVFAARRRKGKQAVDERYGTKDCAEYADFRAVLARPDIDAVVISTPDHWHVTMALLALEALGAVASSLLASMGPQPEGAGALAASLGRRRAFAREEALPAPWHVLPKVSSMPLSVPVSTKLQVPMVPPMSTGCPVNW
jgi:hypothetical protein